MSQNQPKVKGTSQPTSKPKGRQRIVSILRDELAAPS